MPHVFTHFKIVKLVYSRFQPSQFEIFLNNYNQNNGFHCPDESKSPVDNNEKMEF